VNEVESQPWYQLSASAAVELDPERLIGCVDARRNPFHNLWYVMRVVAPRREWLTSRQSYFYLRTLSIKTRFAACPSVCWRANSGRVTGVARQLSASKVSATFRA
jgi:hypothetical protein